MGLNRNLDALVPEVREAFIQLRAYCAAEGIKISISEGLRTRETQAVYYLRGRVDNDPKCYEALKILGAVHAWAFSENEAKRKITWTLDSNHMDGRAVDIIVFDKKGRVTWDANHENWKRTLELARQMGFELGADWAVKDYPHLQIKGE